MLYWTTQTVYQWVQQLIMTRDQREKGWRGILGIKSPDSGRPGAKKKGGGGGQRPPKPEKPQVKPESGARAGTGGGDGRWREGVLRRARIAS